MSTGAKIPISEVHSAPVIVRGRSPRNFQSRKDLPLSGSAAASRKNTQASTSATVNRTPTSDTAPRSSITPARATASTSKSTARGNSPDTPVPAPPPASVAHQASPDWAQIPPSTGSAGSSAAIPPHPSLYQHSQSNPDFSQSTQTQQRASSIAAPINLSILDDDDGGGQKLDTNDPSTSMSSSYSNNDMSQRSMTWDSPVPPAKVRKLAHGVSQADSQNATASLPLLDTTNLQQPFPSSLPFPSDSADLLYEYFPLGLDDWQTPVDAVYRPHMVHHTAMPETKFVPARGRSKRYFAEDVF